MGGVILLLWTLLAWPSFGGTGGVPGGLERERASGPVQDEPFQGDFTDSDWSFLGSQLESAARELPGSRTRRNLIALARGHRSIVPEGPDLDLLDWALEGLESGLEFGSFPDEGFPGTPTPDVRWPLGSEASWCAQGLLAPGPLRGRATAMAVQGLLDGPAGAGILTGERLNRAWEAWTEAALDLRHPEALAIGRPVHRDAQAPWSALSLGLNLTRAGRYREAESVMAAQLERTPLVADLWNQRGITAMGSGRDRASRGFLAHALLLGSYDAASILARMDLRDGFLERARAGFRGILRSDPDNAWSRRGWGLSLLPTRTPRPGVGTGY